MVIRSAILSEQDMKERIKELANNAANEVADQFTLGYFDDRMVENVAEIIYKHYTKRSNYDVYYLADQEGIVAGPFSTVNSAVHGKKNFDESVAILLNVVKSTIQADLV